MTGCISEGAFESGKVGVIEGTLLDFVLASASPLDLHFTQFYLI
jgi:hypothetical protein